MKVWDVESSQETPSLERHNSNVWSVALSPSGRRMVSGSGDKTLKVWEDDSVAIGWMYEPESVHPVHVQRRISRHAVQSFPHIEQFIEVRRLQDVAHITGRKEPLAFNVSEPLLEPTVNTAVNGSPSTSLSLPNTPELATVRTPSCSTL